MSCQRASPQMTSDIHIDPSLRDMTFADVNPAFNLAISQDSRQGADGNSIPGGEPVHRSAFFPPNPQHHLMMSLHFQFSPHCQRPSQTRQTCV